VTHFLLRLVSDYGYVIVFFGVGIESMGVPVPGETALVIGAVSASQGHLAAWGVALAGWGGAVIGDNAGYLIGRRWGRRLLTVRLIRRLYDPRRVAIAERFFERRGWLAVFFGRFVAILRILAGPLAGMHHMPWRTFFLANATGGACWVAVITTLGLLVGNNLDRAVRLVARLGYGGLVLGALAVVSYAAWHWYRRRRERRKGERILAEQTEGRE
jgi:membrane protein DedA with SNARE-associated domain